MIKTIAFSCVALIGLFCASPIRGQCIALSVQEPSELQARRSLTLKPSSISPNAIPTISQRQYKEEPLEELQRSLEEKLRLNLEKTRLFRSVESAKDVAPVSSELTLNVELTNIWQGSRSTIAPIVARSDPSVLEIRGVIMTGDAASLKPVLELICRGSTGGVILKSKKWMHDNIDKVAEGLSNLLISISREKMVPTPALTATYSQSISPLDMLLSSPPNAWAELDKALQHGLGQAGLKPALSPFQTAVSQVNTNGTVIAVWVTKENVDRLLLIYSKILSANKRTLSPRLEDIYITPEKFNQIFRETENAKERMLWVWYAKVGFPYWNKDRINLSTSLSEFGNELKPIRTLIPVPYKVERFNRDSIDSVWVYNSAIFIFPGRRNESSEHGAELHTQLDNHPVVIRF